MSVWQRKDGRWEGRVGHAGKQYWVKGGPFDRKAEALEAERALRARVVRLRPSRETCASFAERWLKEWPREARGTQRAYADAMRQFVREFDTTPLEDVDRQRARLWALSVPRNVSRIASTMYEDARNIELVESNPFANLRLPMRRPEPLVAPTLDEYRALLAGCDALGKYGHEFRVLITFVAWTGLRSGEVQAIKWEDISENEIHVCRARGTEGFLQPPKGGRSRRIAFLPAARVLDQIPKRDGNYVFHGPRAKSLRAWSLSHAWTQAREASGIPAARAEVGKPNLRFHDLRHFYAFRLKEQGLDPYTISIQMGHRDGGALVIERYGMGGEDVANARLLEAFSIPSDPGERVPA